MAGTRARRGRPRLGAASGRVGGGPVDAVNAVEAPASGATGHDFAKFSGERTKECGKAGVFAV